MILVISERAKDLAFRFFEEVSLLTGDFFSPFFLNIKVGKIVAQVFEWYFNAKIGEFQCKISQFIFTVYCYKKLFADEGHIFLPLVFLKKSKNGWPICPAFF